MPEIGSAVEEFRPFEALQELSEGRLRLREKPVNNTPHVYSPRGVQARTYTLYTYMCSPFEVLEKGRHALQATTSKKHASQTCLRPWLVFGFSATAAGSVSILKLQHIGNLDGC